AGILASGASGHSVYLARYADFTVVTRASQPIAVYAKFAKFLIWAEVAPVNRAQWVNTLVVDGPGILCSATQKILDRHFGNLVIDRAEMFRNKRKEAHDGTSPIQQDKIMQWAIDNADHVAQSELMQAILADAASPIWVEP